MNSYFDSKQFIVYNALSCVQAWEELKRYTPLLILLDRNLPEENRNLLLEQLKLDKRFSEVPIKIFVRKEFERKSFFKVRKETQSYKEDIVDYYKF
jgi:DNA-binding response OmpR family regulator